MAIARARQLPMPADVMLFVVGGGNYVEYQNLVEYGKSKGITRVTYGCTELINPKQFLEQVKNPWICDMCKPVMLDTTLSSEVLQSS